MWCNERSMPCGREALADRAACPASDHVFLQRHDARVAGGEPAHGVRVQRLDEAHVDQRRVEPFGDREAGHYHRAESKQQQAGAALAADLRATDRQRLHVGLDARAGALAARVTHRRRAIVRHGRVKHLPAFVFVGRRHHHHARHAAQVGEVERALVRRSVAAHETRAVDAQRSRAVLAAPRRGSTGHRPVAETSSRSRPRVSRPRRRIPRRASQRAARRWRRRNNGPGSGARIRPGPSLRASPA